MFHGESGGAMVDAKSAFPQTMTDRLRTMKKDLEDKLEQVNEALAALESNPEVARTVDAISKLGHF